MNSHTNINNSMAQISRPQTYQQPTGRVYPHEEVSGALIDRQKLVDDYYQDYKPANYEKALHFFYENSYMEKKGPNQYQKLPMLGPTKDFKKFGVGIYLYVELLRRLMWVFIVVGLLSIVPLYLNYTGSGLSKYSLSYGTYLITASLGNYSNKATDYDAYIITGIHCLNNLIFFIWFLIWKGHALGQIESFETDHQIVHPKKYCVEVCGLPKKGVSNKDLEAYFTQFGPVYECSIVYDYQDNLRYFQQIEELDEQIKVMELELRLGGGDMDDLKSLKEDKQAVVKLINNMKISPQILSAYIHFEYMKDKNEMLNHFSDRYLFDTGLHSCGRTICCCVPPTDSKTLFQGQQLHILHSKVNDPEQINWQSVDVSDCSRCVRVTIAVVIIIVFIAVCSTLVSLCSIFISVNSTNCDGVPTITLAVAQTTTNSTEKTCFCNSNLLQFSDSSIQELCVEIFKKLYVQNGLQIAAAVISTLTNALFSLIIRSIINFTKPKSFSSSLITKTLVLFLFLLLNTCLLPLLIYADVYTFKIASYVSLIKLINPQIDSFFNMDSFTYYEDFSNIWYRNVSPYFINFLVLNLILVWVGFAWKACRAGRRIENQREDEGMILQKHMNQRITDFEVDVVGETAELFLVVFISFMYSAGLPAMMLIGALNILSRYFVNKHLITHYSKRIQGLTQDFSQLSIGILPWSIIISSLFGIWMQTACSYIYSTAMSIQISPLSQYQSLVSVFPRIFYISYTFILVAIVVVYYFLYNTLIRFFKWLGSLCYESKETVRVVERRSFSEASKTMNVLHSYNIHSNPKYKNVVLNLERYLEDEE